MKDLEITLDNHATFYAIAYRHHEEIVRIVSERDRREVKTEEDVEYQALANAEIQRGAMVVVIFSALTLEAFINHYAIENVSKSYFDEHIDRLGPRSKWLLVPKLVKSSELPRDGQAYEGITKLFKLRDKLVHYKTRKKKLSDLKEDEDWVTEDHAKASLETVELATKALQMLDSSVDIDWLENAKRDPFA